MNQRLLRLLFSGAYQIQARISRQITRMERFLEGAALGSLTPESRSQLTKTLYGAQPVALFPIEAGLYQWEKRWFEADLPTPPASLLVGGAGSGRELRWLAEQGYRILAFDPVASFVKRAGEWVGDQRTELCVGSYEELAGTGRGSAQEQFDAAVCAAAPFDAILLGWGSFTHVAAAETRLKLLNRLRQLCPSGPVLFSFWMRSDQELRHRGVLWNSGLRLGRWLHSEPSIPAPTAGDRFVHHAGYGHAFSMPEIEELARRSGYRIQRSPGDSPGSFPHATLIPGDPEKENV